MAETIITHFDLDPQRLEILRPCMENGGEDDGELDWPSNVISCRTVAYGSGIIARRDAPVRHAVLADEWELCRRLAVQALVPMQGEYVGLGSAGGDMFSEFFIAATVDDPIPARIDEDLIRSRFGGTLFPLAEVAVEPLIEGGGLWERLASCDTPLEPWIAAVHWFHTQSEFTDRAFVFIGENLEELAFSDAEMPDGVTPDGVLPVMLLGLTQRGSLAGLFGPCVRA